VCESINRQRSGRTRLYSDAADARFQRLRALMERDWTPGLAKLPDINLDALPIIWDADFLLGPKGDDSFVLCEINMSSVFPMPEGAPEAPARTTLHRLAMTSGARPKINPQLFATENSHD
jgi:hypothetical protein